MSPHPRAAAEVPAASHAARTGVRRRALLASAIAFPLVAAGCASRPAASVVSELVPSGALRAIINYGNPVLARRDAQGQPSGLSVDLAREVGRRLGVPVQLETVDSARLSVETLKERKADLGFVAIDPVRGADVDYTAPYVIIEGAYLVRANSPLTRNEEVDRSGTRIAVGRGSAYDLHLTREIKAATLVRSANSASVVDDFLAANLEVAAGVRQQLEADGRRLGGVRLLPGRFMVIEQAMGVPKGRLQAQAWLSAFIEEMKASGFVAESLRRHGVEGALVAPARR